MLFSLLQTHQLLYLVLFVQQLEQQDEVLQASEQIFTFLAGEATSFSIASGASSVVTYGLASSVGSRPAT